MAQIRMITDRKVGTAHTRRHNGCLGTENTSACLTKPMVHNHCALPEDIAHSQPWLAKDAPGAGAMPVPGRSLAAAAADGAAQSKWANYPAACLPPAGQHPAVPGPGAIARLALAAGPSCCW